MRIGDVSDAEKRKIAMPQTVYAADAAVWFAGESYVPSKRG
jgi:hypothetical protein